MHPVYGESGTGANTYTEIIAARAGGDDFNFLICWCATQDALVSLDDGTTDNFPIPAGKEPMMVPVGRVSASIQAKNRTADSNYESLVIIACRFER